MFILEQNNQRGRWGYFCSILWVFLIFYEIILYFRFICFHDQSFHYSYRNPLFAFIFSKTWFFYCPLSFEIIYLYSWIIWQSIESIRFSFWWDLFVLSRKFWYLIHFVCKVYNSFLWNTLHCRMKIMLDLKKKKKNPKSDQNRTDVGTKHT